MHLRNEFKKIILLFIGWRIYLVLVSLIASSFVPLASQDRFLGGGWDLYSLAPGFFGWANFDGEHYLSIAIFGYKALEQAFFPIYPKLIALFIKPDLTNLSSVYISATMIGLVISNLSFFLSLVLLWDLIRLDYKQDIAWWVLIMMIVFPTSFYYGSLYNASLYLFLVISTIYAARRQKWWLAAGLGLIASATRIFGFLLLPTLLVEAKIQHEKLRNILPILLIPGGLILYMLYQYKVFNDPLAFYHLQLVVGEQHQPGIVLLPQVFYRYVKMVITVDPFNTIYQTILLELVTAVVMVFLWIYGLLKKIRISYLVYFLLAFILPTIQGSFSSTPRYVLTLFPGFLAMAILITGFPKIIKVLLIIILLVINVVETSLFLRGYWVA